MKTSQKDRDKDLGLGAKIAPAVGLLLFGEAAVASDDADEPGTIPEPSVLALLAAGAVGAGVARALKKRRKK